jgi:hypothetical protein
LLDNVGSEHFDQSSFVTAYNDDTRVNKLVSSFDENGIVLVGGEDPANPEPVDNMAKSATKNALK